MRRGNARIRVARPIVGFRPELLSLEGREMPGETLGLSGLAWLPAGSV
jgi:hypothetical protein